MTALPNSPSALLDIYAHDDLVEQSVIATVLRRPEWVQALGKVTSDDFHLETHARIWRVIEAHAGDGKPVSIMAVASELRNDDEVHTAGGVAYLNELAVGCCPWSEGEARAVADKLRELTASRRLQFTLETGLAELAERPVDMPVVTVQSRMLEALTSLQADSLQSGPQPVSAAVDAILARAEDASSAPVLTVHSGLRDLDEMMGGYRAGELHVIGGRPGMGKTIVGANLAINAAREGHGGIYFSLEMTRDQITGRILCDMVHAQGLELWTRTLRAGSVRAEYLRPLLRAKDELETMPLWVDDLRGQSLTQVATKCRFVDRALKKKGNALEFIVIDYMTLLTPADRYRGQKVNEVTELSRGLKILAGEFGIPVIALVQLNRQTEDRNNKDNRPRLADIRESGSIEQDADSVTLLYREEYYVQQRKPAMPGTETYRMWQAQYAECRDRLEMIVAKNREGETGTVQARVIARCSAVRDM